MADPVKDAKIFEQLSYREFNGWAQSTGLRRPADTKALPVSASSMYYRVPLPGQKVAVSGMRHRSQLNGSRAEVLPGSPDQFGRILVRIEGDARLGEARTMLIQPSRLLPLAGSGLRDEDAMSIATCSRTGSESALFRVPPSIASAATSILQGGGSGGAGMMSRRSASASASRLGKGGLGP